MKLRVWINIFLLLVCIGLSLFLIYNPGKHEALIMSSLSNIDRTAMNLIFIHRMGKPDIKFEKQRGRWSMIFPMEIAANPTRINAILELLNADSHAQFDSEAIDPARFELDPAHLVLELNEYRFQFGNTENIDSKRYVMFNETVHLVDDWLYPQLMAPYYFFIDLHLLPAGQKITAFEYAGDSYRLNNGIWRSDSENAIGADDIADTVRAWQESRALSVIESTGNGASADVRITLGSIVMQFSMVKNDTEFILIQPDLGIAYRMPQSDMAKLFPEWEED